MLDRYGIRAWLKSLFFYKKRAWGKISNLGPIDCVVDVGVARGTPELYSAFPNAKLILVDPLVESESYIRENYSNRNIYFHCCAVGSDNGTLKINVEKDEIGSSSVLLRTALTNGGGVQEQRLVPVRTLNELLPKKSLGQRNCLKIDAEGYELEVLKGATNILPEIDILICEISVMERFYDSYTFNDIYTFIRDNNFRLHSILGAPMDKDQNIRFLDAVFIPKTIRKNYDV